MLDLRCIALLAVLWAVCSTEPSQCQKHMRANIGLVLEDLPIHLEMVSQIKQITETFTFIRPDVEVFFQTQHVGNMSRNDRDVIIMEVLRACYILLAARVDGLLLLIDCDVLEPVKQELTKLGVPHAASRDCNLMKFNNGITHKFLPDNFLEDIILAIWENTFQPEEGSLLYDQTTDPGTISGLMERFSNASGATIASYPDYTLQTLDRHTGLSYHKNLRMNPDKWNLLFVFGSTETITKVLAVAADCKLNTRFHFWVVVLNRKWLLPEDITDSILHNWTKSNLIFLTRHEEICNRALLHKYNHKARSWHLEQVWFGLLSVIYRQRSTMFNLTGCNDEIFLDESQARYILSSKPSPNLDVGNLNKLQQDNNDNDIIGTWRTSDPKGLILSTRGRLFPHPPLDLEGHTFQAGITFDFPPYVQTVPGSDCCSTVFSHKDKWPFNGFAVDLFKELASALNFTVKFHRGETVGKPLENGSWSGLFGLLLNKDVDMLIGPFTMTAERSLAFRFTGPYMQDIIKIMMLKHRTSSVWQETEVFLPFSLEVWLFIGGSIACFGLMLLLIRASEGFTAKFSKHQGTHELNSQISKEDMTTPCNYGEESRSIFGSRMNNAFFLHGSIVRNKDDGNHEKVVIQHWVKWLQEPNQNDSQDLAAKQKEETDSLSLDEELFELDPPARGYNKQKTSPNEQGTCAHMREEETSARSGGIAKCTAKYSGSTSLMEGESTQESYYMKMIWMAIDSLWSSYGLWFEQGSTYYPISISGRLLVVFWWLFTIVLSASYTANLTAVLSVSDNQLEINSLDDLAIPNTALRPLILRDTNLQDLLENAPAGTVYSKIWSRIMTNPDPPPRVLEDEALRLVDTGNYALLQEEGILLSIVNKMCEKYVLAEKGFNPTGLRFIVRNDSHYSILFDMVGVKLQENGLVAKYRDLYWPKETSCAWQNSGKTNPDPVNLNQMTGAFLILILAAIAAMVTLTCEYGYVSVRNHKHAIVTSNTQDDGLEAREWNEIL